MQVGQCKTDTISPHGTLRLSWRDPWGGHSPGRTPGAIAIKMGVTVSAGTDLRLCAKFQPNSFSRFGEDASQRDRQTNSKLYLLFSWRT